MSGNDESRVRELARAFRIAIESTPRSALPIGLAEFPVGACGDATMLLAKYLEEHGWGRSEYIEGRWRDGTTHAWLSIGDLIVDITGDQFEGMDCSVFVGRTSTWHVSFDQEPPRNADFDAYDEGTRSQLRAAYVSVLRASPNP